MSRLFGIKYKYMEIINGKKIAEKIKDDIALVIAEHPDERPNLAIILVGNREDSELYVALKEKQAKLVGVDTHTYRVDVSEGEAGLHEVINYLNEDQLIDAILLQLPLPEGFDEDTAVALISEHKDVDGFHPETIKKYCAAQEVVAVPVVPTVVREMLADIKFDGDGKQAVVVANSEVFGEVLRFELENIGLSVAVCKADEKNLNAQLLDADLIVTAVGQPRYLKEEMIKKDVVIIDIGISKDSLGVVCGDVDFESVKNKAGFVSPVPGGVGPMTIAVALSNALKLYQVRKK